MLVLSYDWKNWISSHWEGRDTMKVQLPPIHKLHRSKGLRKSIAIVLYCFKLKSKTRSAHLAQAVKKRLVFSIQVQNCEQKPLYIWWNPQCITHTYIPPLLLLLPLLVVVILLIIITLRPKILLGEATVDGISHGVGGYRKSVMTQTLNHFSPVG